MLSAIFLEALNACSAENLVLSKIVSLAENESRKIWVFGAGKAAAGMARGVLKKFGSRINGGAIILVEGIEPELTALGPIAVLRGSHPRPDQKSVDATEALLRHIALCQPGDHAFFVLSGGASSLLCRPCNGLSVQTKAELADALMACGAPIAEINTVRKHLSMVKGGQLGSLFKCTVHVLVLSDVAGDSIETIGSGPLAFDSTTRADAEAILKNRLKRTVDAMIETPKTVSSTIEHTVVGNGLMLAQTAAKTASKHGVGKIICESLPIEGEVRQVAQSYAQFVKDNQRDAPLLLVRFGEPTVSMSSPVGKGGRNQHLALMLARELKGVGGWQFLAAGSDGIDGNTSSAGAIVDGQTWTLALNAGIDAESHLSRFDSHAVHKSLKSLINTGSTGNNLQDLHLLILR